MLGAVCAGLLAVVMLVPGPATGAWAPDPGPTPRANCGPGSTPETAAQGRVPAADVESGRAREGYTCNMIELSHFGTTGGLKVHRYVDAAGHECAYYDSTILFPLDVLESGRKLPGVYVMDMSDPAHPVKTANLTTPAMLSPHESLMIRPRRGLLMAAMGSALFHPGIVDIYDISRDCRHPVLRSSSPLGILGHESGLSPDEKTFWVTSTAGRTITALDITNPALPVPLWVGTQWLPHGVRVSSDGNRLYVADVVDGLHILDVSDVQRRAARPRVREIAFLDWPEISIPQVPIPVTIAGHPYLIEIDEFGYSYRDRGARRVGAARIIDIGDDTAPRVISNIRLEVHMPDAQAGEQKDDPSAGNGLGGYSGHYCAVPRTDNPGIVACTFVLSGLRVFDVRDPYHPKEIAYFNKPVKGQASDDPPTSFAASAPAFVPERGEIRYTDANSGFWALRVTNGVWPFPAA